MGTEDEARAKILERRKRFIALALLGSSSVTATACACLRISVDVGPADVGVDAADAATSEGDDE
jgi:hypothetical protein